jgi:hypothetical protein
MRGGVIVGQDEMESFAKYLADVASCACITAAEFAENIRVFAEGTADCFMVKIYGKRRKRLYKPVILCDWAIDKRLKWHRIRSDC